MFYDFFMRFDLEFIEVDLCVYILKIEFCFIIMLFVDDGIVVCFLLVCFEVFVFYMEEYFVIICFNED